MIYNYIQGFRLINAIVRSLPAANIETLLTDEVRASAFTKACGFYSQQSRFLETPLALQNLALSAKAYALLPEGVRLGILNDQTAIQNLTATILGEDPATFTFDDISQFVGDQAVMSVVFSSEPASQVIAASTTAMNAIVNSGAALSLLWGKAPVIAALKISDAGRKAFVDSTDYTNVFKPAVLAGIVPDGMIFTASGTFTVPGYITSVHVVCVGAGGVGGAGGLSKYVESNSVRGYGGQGGGGGGALRWGNNIAVSYQDQIAVSVGSPSSFRTVIANGGAAATAPSTYAGTAGGAGGSGSGGDGGYDGGTGGYGADGGGGGSGGGGGGNGAAGGYNAKGGYGGGGGAGGDAPMGANVAGTSGQPGSNGVGGAPSSNAGTGTGGGSGGSVKANSASSYIGAAGGPGGPGVGSSPYGPSVVGDYGTRGKGVVRIIWGASRAFPSTNVEKIV